MTIRNKFIIPIVTIFVIGSTFLTILINMRESSQHISMEKEAWINIGNMLTNSWKNTMVYTGSENLAHKQFYVKPLDYEISRRIVRNPNLFHIYPDSSAATSTQLEKQVIAEGKVISTIIETEISRNLMTLVPIVAEKQCVACHMHNGEQDIQPGEIMGVITLTSNMEHVDMLIASNRNAIFFGMIVVILLGTIFVYIFITRLTTPITILMEKARLIAVGKLDVQTGIHRDDELGVLANVFDEMTEKLRDSRTKMEEHSRNLEQLVEEQLREIKESEEKFRNIVENSHDVIMLTQLDGVISYISPSCLEVFGYKPEELIGKRPWIIQTDDLDRVEKYYFQSLKEEKGSSFNYRIKTKKKENRWVTHTVTPIFTDGEFKMVVNIVRDITEHKRAEELKSSIYRISEAAQSDQKLEDLFSSIHNIIGELIHAKNFYIALYDSDSKIISFPYFVDEFDKTPVHKKAGKGLTEYVLRTGKPLLASPEVFKELVKKGEVEEIGTQSVDWLGVPLKTEDKSIGVLVVQSYTKGVRFGEEEKSILTFVSEQIAMTIERKRMDESLYNAHELLQITHDTLLDAVISTDMDYNIVSCNKAVQNIFGYTPNELTGKNYSIIMSKEMLDPEQQTKQKELLEKGYLMTDDFYFKRKNGKIFPARFSVAVIRDEQGNPTGLVGSVHDITERKLAREKLEVALEKAKKSERIKALFMANMSHEIRTPLNAILGFTDLLETSTSHLISEKEQEFFNMIRSSGNRLMDTVHEILDISQIEAGTYDLKIEKVNLLTLVKDLVNGIKPMADKKGLEIAYNSALNSAFIKVDQNGVSQAISNILDNAVKYTKLGKITVSLEQKAEQYILTIQDTGIGIAEEYLENLFDVFSQESEGYTKKYQGIGLGMAIAQRHLNMNSVGIDVESTKDVGTTFTLTFKPVKKPLPIKRVEKEEAKVKPAAEPAEKPLVLSVEDDPNSQRLIEFFLKEQYDICFAVSVDEAKEQLKQSQVDLILLDLSLVGDEDGLDLVKWMRKTKNWKKTPVIATTAHAFTTDQNNCLTAGCNDYLSKPIKREKLLETISAFL